MKNRKNKLNNYLKLGILLFGISLFLWSCEKDFDSNLENINSEHQHPTSEFNIENLSLEEISNDMVFKDFQQKINISKIQDKNTIFQKAKISLKTHNTFNRNTEHPIIFTDKVKKIQKGDYTSYTFKLIFPSYNNSNEFYNLVLQENNGEQEIFTFKYYTSQQNKNTKNKSLLTNYTMSRGLCYPDQHACNGGNDNNSGGGSNTSGITCTEFIVLVSVPCTGQGNHEVGQTCLCGTFSNGGYVSCNRAYLREEKRLDCISNTTGEPVDYSDYTTGGSFGGGFNNNNSSTLT